MIGSAGDGEPSLLRRIAAADLAAFEALYDLYASMAYGVALRITRDEALAQDVVQDAFLAVWRHASRYDAARASVKTWLLAIVHHRAVDVVRERRPSEELPAEDDEGLPARLTLPDVWGEVAERLDAARVQRALATLPPRQREALVLAYFGGLTQEEIAVRTGAPLGTVKGRVRLGLLGLRHELAAEQPLEEADAGTAGPATAEVDAVWPAGGTEPPATPSGQETAP